MGRLLAGGDQHGVPIGTTGCIQESAESTEPVLDARWQGSNAGISLDGGAFTRQSNGNGGPGLEPGSMPASVPIPLAAAGACSGSQAFAGEDGAMTHSSSGCAAIPASQQLLPPNAPAQQQPLQVTQQPPDLGAGSPRANSRVQASMQAGAMEAPESQEQPRLDPLEGALSQGQGAVQQARSEPGLQPQPQEQRQQQAATQEHLHASPDGSSYKRPRRAAASKRHTSADMLYEDMGGGGGGWESLPGFEEGTVVLPGVHNPGGLVHTGSAGGSDSEGTRSEGGLETEDEEDIDEQEETDEDSSGASSAGAWLVCYHCLLTPLLAGRARNSVH
ncbi:hypothetical protein DUNSADRAFT_4186 [Dunaliella salina]|uniref:Encoded protein n=1 Tax=Dunaliella salina TaxID=3046 RepID=A0ABQ7GSH3_DUNSA|nr:hypothetical protein DUNSADRAFT_4186 [Dunaliella salina]|eukprot:KAF5837550.1 hypothetical protein DUNSADRAFT_4186 [Dunaliella salina]